MARASRCVLQGKPRGIYTSYNEEETTLIKSEEETNMSKVNTNENVVVTTEFVPEVEEAVVEKKDGWFKRKSKSMLGYAKTHKRGLVTTGLLAGAGLLIYALAKGSKAEEDEEVYDADLVDVELEPLDDGEELVEDETEE